MAPKATVKPAKAAAAVAKPAPKAAPAKAAVRKPVSAKAAATAKAAPVRKTTNARATERPAPAKSAPAKNAAPAKQPVRSAPSKPAPVKAAPAKPAKPPVRPAPIPARPSRPASKEKESHRAPQAPRLAVVVKAFEAGLKSFNKGDFAGARDAFERLVAQYPSQTDIVARSNMYLTICRARTAKPASSGPNTAETFYDRGVFELNRARYDDAIELFERALKSQPNAAHVLYSLAAAQARSGRADEGMRTLERAIEQREISRSRARHDGDFASLRTNTRFQELVGPAYDSDSR